MITLKPYYYNPRNASKTLHLFGCCPNSKSINDKDILWFDTENEVLAHAGLCYKWCEECLKKREEILKASINEREDKEK